MDFTAIIQSNIDSILELRDLSGLKNIIRHLRRAEELYSQGLNQEENEFFTESILRNNLAFEAILREAYNVYSEPSSKDKSLFEIENFFLNNNILSERIMTEFQNYRKKWRNLSTHSYSLYFDKHDALFSLTSLLGFSSILLSEILRKVIYDHELSKDQNTNSTNNPDQKLIEYVMESIVKWVKSLNHEQDYQLREVEITAMLKAYFENHSSVPLNIQYDYKTETNNRIDLLISKGDEKVIIELKRNLYLSHVDRGLAQLTTYMQSIENSDGVLFFYSPNFEKELGMDIHNFDFMGKKRKAYVIHPISMDP